MPDLLGSDRYLHRARFVDGVVTPVFAAEQVAAWFAAMPSLRVGALFDLARAVKVARYA